MCSPAGGGHRAGRLPSSSAGCRSRCWNAPMPDNLRASGSSRREFAVWAPLPDRVRLDLAGALHPMEREDDGWWRATVDAAPDARYGFVLDDEPDVLPDPRSGRQPDGVYG